MPETTTYLTSLDEHGQVALPEAVRVAAHLVANAQFVIRIQPDDSIVLEPIRDPDQAWFWTEEWQAGERRVDAQIAAGMGTIYMSGEEFLQSLRDRMKKDGDADL